MQKSRIGARIRARREAAGLKQRAVAADAGISASYLNLIEHDRRLVGGRVLNNIARALSVDVAALAQTANADLSRLLQLAAARDATANPEIDQIENFIDRLPGWAGLTGALEKRVASIERVVENLNDRLTHDPFLAESLHEILSSVTAIHATSAILVQGGDVPLAQQARFQSNIHQESARLAEISRALVSYFDRLAEAGQPLATPLDEVEAALAKTGYHFAGIESSGSDGTGSTLAAIAPGGSNAARKMTHSILDQYARDAASMPLDRFLAAARACGFQPATLALNFEQPLDAVYRRLAFLPKTDEIPAFGLIVCDGAGAFLLRKPIAGFALPRYGAGCAVWPLYRAMAHPHLAVDAVLKSGDEQLFDAHAICVYKTHDPARPFLRATMILRAATPQTAASARWIEPVGQSCRICPHADCAARREPSIHDQIA